METSLIDLCDSDSSDESASSERRAESALTSKTPATKSGAPSNRGTLNSTEALRTYPSLKCNASDIAAYCADSDDSDGSFIPPPSLFAKSASCRPLKTYLKADLAKGENAKATPTFVDTAIDLPVDSDSEDSICLSPALKCKTTVDSSNRCYEKRKAIIHNRKTSQKRKAVTQSSISGESSSTLHEDSEDSIYSSSGFRKQKMASGNVSVSKPKPKGRVGHQPKQPEESPHRVGKSSPSVVMLLSSDDELETCSDRRNSASDSALSAGAAAASKPSSNVARTPAVIARARSTLLNDTLSDLESPVFQPELGVRMRTPREREPYALNESTDLESPVFQPEIGKTSGGAQKCAGGESGGSRGCVNRKVLTPPIPDLMNELGGRLYPDLRHEFVKALSVHAKTVRRASYQRTAFDATVRAITIISLRPHPIRSADAVKCIKGVGTELLGVLKDASKNLKNNPYVPGRGKFSAVAPAALVALLEHERQKPNEPLCMEELIHRINLLIDPAANAAMKNEISHYLDKDTMDPGWNQIKKLCSGNTNAGLIPLVKERRKKSMCDSGIVFELLDQGRKVARRLKEAAQAGPVPFGPLRQLAADVVDQEYGNVTLSMDFREGGGGSKSLHKMCDLLDEHGVPFVVRELKISDYVFFVGSKLAPLLIERKTADDVANSLADGRWERQQRNMRKAQYVLGGGEARRCQICYLIEGDPSRRTVHGGNVGRVSWNQSLEDVENAIELLPKLGFSVMRSKSHMGSMVILARIARDVCWKANNGSIDATQTYEEFLDNVRSLDDKEGDPPTSREHQYPAAPVVNATNLQYESAPASGDAMEETNNQGDDRSDSEVGPQETHGVNEKEDELKKLSVSELKQKCKDRDEKQSGTKAELIARLLKPRKPEILITRARRGQYIPKINSCNAALLVALFLNHRHGADGLTKESLLMLAEETGVSKEPMDAKNGFYDGWSGMSTMTKGDPALVYVRKRKYSLTTQPLGGAGYDIAKALHTLTHLEGICKCGSHSLP